MNLTFKPHVFNVRTLCEGVCSRMCAVYYETRVSGSMRYRCKHVLSIYMYVRYAKEYMLALCVQCITRLHALPMQDMCFQCTCAYAMRRSTCLRCVYSVHVLRGVCLAPCVADAIHVLSMYISYAKEYMLALCVQCITRCVSGSELHALPKQYVCKKIAFSPLALNFLFLVVTDTFVMFFFVLGST